MVTQQRREIGIRMALGAERATVLRAVMGHGLKLTCVGLVAGLAAALVLTRLMETLLFEVRPNDPGDAGGRGGAHHRRGRCRQPRSRRSAPRASIRSWRSRTSSDCHTFELRFVRDGALTFRALERIG